MGHVVSCEHLRDEGLHKLLAMVGYCMTDNGEEHFEFVHHIVSTEHMNEGVMENAKFEKVGLNTRANLSHSNILQIAYQWACFVRNVFLVLVFMVLYCICTRAGNSIPWVIPLRSKGTDVKRCRDAG